MLTLFDINKDLCDAWVAQFHDCLEVKILHTSLEDLPSHQYLVTAGNSYAIMDGGIDRAVRDMLGVEVQDAVQWCSVITYGGFIPIGAHIAVNTNNEKFPCLIYVPTMSVPMKIDSTNIYYAMTGFLGSYLRTQESIACCGLRTLTGQIPVADAARIMKKAYKTVCEAI